MRTSHVYSAILTWRCSSQLSNFFWKPHFNQPQLVDQGTSVQPNPNLSFLIIDYNNLVGRSSTCISMLIVQSNYLRHRLVYFIPTLFSHPACAWLVLYSSLFQRVRSLMHPQRTVWLLKWKVRMSALLVNNFGYNKRANLIDMWIDCKRGLKNFKALLA